MSWYGSEKQITNNSYNNNLSSNGTWAGRNIMNASKNIGQTFINLGEDQDKQKRIAKMDLERQKQIAKLDQEKQEEKQKKIDEENALIAAYEEKYPKFMGKVDKDGNELEAYKHKSRLEKLALIKVVGNEMSKHKDKTAVRFYIGDDGYGRLVFSDGSEKKLSKVYRNNSGGGNLSSKKSGDNGYGKNPDGSFMTAQQFGENEANQHWKEYLERKNLGNTNINLPKTATQLTGKKKKPLAQANIDKPPPKKVIQPRGKNIKIPSFDLTTF